MDHLTRLGFSLVHIEAAIRVAELILKERQKPPKVTNLAHRFSAFPPSSFSIRLVRKDPTKAAMVMMPPVRCYCCCWLPLLVVGRINLVVVVQWLTSYRPRPSASHANTRAILAVRSPESLVVHCGYLPHLDAVCQ